MLSQDEGAATEPEEDDGVPIAGSQLAEAFVDDAWGTAKSVEDLKEHRDYKKWLKGKGLTAAGVEGLEKRLGLYQVPLPDVSAQYESAPAMPTVGGVLGGVCGGGETRRGGWGRKLLTSGRAAGQPPMQILTSLNR